jgi:hypothetical protein
MNLSKKFLGFLGVAAVLGVALACPAVASATIITSTTGSVTLVKIQQPGGTVGAPSSFTNGTGIPGFGTNLTIGFDQYNNGDPVTTPATGVTFALVTPTSGGKLVATAAGGSITDLQNPGSSISSPNVLTAWNDVNRLSTAHADAPTVSVTFAPINGQLPRSVGFVFVGAPLNDLLTISIFDGQGNLVGSMTNNTGDGLPSVGASEPCFLGFEYYDALNQLSPIGIGRLEYSLDHNYGIVSPYVQLGDSIDDVQFELRSGTPEPATLILLGLGSTALMAYRRRNRAGR